jgi:hypothetical protein
MLGVNLYSKIAENGVFLQPQRKIKGRALARPSWMPG